MTGYDGRSTTSRSDFTSTGLQTKVTRATGKSLNNIARIEEAMLHLVAPVQLMPAAQL